MEGGKTGGNECSSPACSSSLSLASLPQSSLEGCPPLSHFVHNLSLECSFMSFLLSLMAGYYQSCGSQLSAPQMIEINGDSCVEVLESEKSVRFPVVFLYPAFFTKGDFSPVICIDPATE